MPGQEMFRAGNTYQPPNGSAICDKLHTYYTYSCLSRGVEEEVVARDEHPTAAEQIPVLHESLGMRETSLGGATGGRYSQFKTQLTLGDFRKITVRFSPISHRSFYARHNLQIC